MGYRPSKRRRASWWELELNLTSLMDLMTILLVFLLVTAVFAKTAIIDAYLPQETGEGAGPAPEVLVVSVKEDGFGLGGLGGEVAVPNVDGGLDFNGLSREVLKIKERYPQKEEVVLLFDPMASYETVIKVMDATRETKDGKMSLFPMVSLGEYS